MQGRSSGGEDLPIFLFCFVLILSGNNRTLGFEENIEKILLTSGIIENDNVVNNFLKIRLISL